MGRFTLVLLALLSLPFVLAASAVASGGTIQGTVTSLSTGKPVSGVEVCREEAAEVSCVETGAAGEYDLGETWGIIEFLAPTGSGYVHRSYFDEKYIPKEAETISSPATVDAQLLSEGRIEGVVTNAVTKAPIGGFEVCASPSAAWPEEPTCVSTDAAGIYEFYGLAPVWYTVKFKPGTLNYLPETAQRYYEQGAQVFAGRTTANIDVAVPEGAQIEGQLKSAATGLSIAGVQACATGFGPALETKCATTDAEGRYLIDGLESSSYYMSFWPQRPYVAQRYQAGKPMWVNQGEKLSGINASLQTGTTISGVVTSATGAYPLQAVEVCLSEHVVEEFDGMAPREENSGYCTEPNTAGEYHLDGIATSTDIVQFLPKSNPYDYEEQYWNNAGNETEATQLHTTAGENITGINAALVPWHGVIAGRVTSYVGGQGIAGAEVCARTVTGDSWPPPACVHANAQGEYEISVPRGGYNVEFASPSQSQDYVTEFYDGKLSILEDQPVMVSAGSTTTGINAELVQRTSPGPLIAGVVSNAASQQPIAGIEVCAYEAREEAEDLFGQCTTTESEGKYSIPGLIGGIKYTVEFSSPSNSGLDYVTQYYEDATSPGEATTVTLDYETVDLSIDAHLHEGGQISGQVTDAASHAAIQGISVCAYSEQAEAVIGACASTKENGQYTIGGLPKGEYVVEFAGPPESTIDYARQYFDGQSSAKNATVVPVVVGETRAGVDAQMRPGGRVEGRVAAAGGGPLANALVCALTTPAEAAACALTGRYGEYAIGGLPAGSYVIGFQATKLYAVQYYDDQATYAAAQTVQVTAGADTAGIGALMSPPSVPPSPPPPPHVPQHPQPPANNAPSTSSPSTPSTPTSGSTTDSGVAAYSGSAAARVALVSLSLATSLISGQTAQVTLMCSGAPCAGTAQLSMQIAVREPHGKHWMTRHETITLARGPFALTEDKRAKVTLRLTPAGRRRLANTKHHPITGDITLTLAGGRTVTHSIVMRWR